MTKTTAPACLDRQLACEHADLSQEVLELRHANRELEAFCQAISHDLRASLTSIYTSGQALQEYADELDANGRFFVNSINEGCNRAEATLDALMTLSRVNEAEVARAQVDLSSIARKTAADLHRLEPSRAVRFKIGRQLRVQADPLLLPIALDNLIRNAWKYTSRAPEPLIELGSMTSTEGETVFFLKDNGVGFDSARSEELFLPFRRLHSPQDFPGNGLGLATVRRIIRRHNGRIWGEGRPGCGATFYFTVNG